MFARVFAVLPFALLAVATNGFCNSETHQCCGQYSTVEQAAGNVDYLPILTAFNNLDPESYIALDCTAVADNSCAAASTCCIGTRDDNGFSLINASCNTIQA